MKKRLFFILIVVFMSINLYGKKVSEEQCKTLGENYIFVSGECIQFASFEGETNDHIIVIVHGTWDEGTNTLGRYSPFAETMNLNSDLTTIAIALPGYSNSSTNKFQSLSSKSVKNQAARKEYVLFLGDIISALKNKFKAKKVTYIGHSAGARMGATLTGLRPNLIQNIALAGGRYELKDEDKNKGFISFAEVIDNVNKDTNFLFIYGTKDKISKPELTTEFYKKAIKKGLKAKLIKVEGAEHIDLDMSDESIEAIMEMLEEE